ncbi:MAG: hypothetical protein A2909_01800 [Candidatus Tagabacteria bacterium RIFCSPLOWO2_01_FULL_39_11]|uniref:Uncharacterized protein n=1 Tax=Candidatus Tagabacteria bacterium RIFCSPLOWO2_01_FULL_39_11 TaxID=1802295 RepID=A0A1G2LP47_9BACT|nr:MAG: hypothetical protein A2909_01800 [Candidatus Tagabacteria bacterium RIFCSPLOWO2_01_FULL_39_11]
MAEAASIFVIFIRFFVPLTILRWPLGGAVIAIFGDISDVMIMEKFGWGYSGDGSYHNFDKFFDTYYLFFEFLAVHRWQNTLARRTAKTLFLWRFVGFAIFEFTGFRPAFALAPNIFEHFYLFWAAIIRFFPSFVLTPARLVIALLILGLPKVAQEYLMHYKYPDQTWNFIRDHFFWWLY